MKYCVDYKKGFKYLNEIDELTITYKRKDNTLLEFLQLYANDHCRINIYIQDEQDFIKNKCIKFFEAIVKNYPSINFALKLRGYKLNSNVPQLYDIITSSSVKIPYFFDTLVKDWDTLNGYINLHPCDIYIVEELRFSLKTIGTMLHSGNIRVRTFANVGQSSWQDIPALKKFFIRPEDVTIYEPYVDVIEFFGRENSVETYYKIYAKEKKWFGRLDEVILDLDTDVDSKFLLPSFAKRRLNCGKRCFKGRPCQICEVTEQLSKVLDKNNIMISTLES